MPGERVASAKLRPARSLGRALELWRALTPARERCVLGHVPTLLSSLAGMSACMVGT